MCESGETCACACASRLDSTFPPESDGTMWNQVSLGLIEYISLSEYFSLELFVKRDPHKLLLTLIQGNDTMIKGNRVHGL